MTLVITTERMSRDEAKPTVHAHQFASDRVQDATLLTPRPHHDAEWCGSLLREPRSPDRTPRRCRVETDGRRRRRRSVGLTRAGRRIVEEAHRLRILLDVAGRAAPLLPPLCLPGNFLIASDVLWPAPSHGPPTAHPGRWPVAEATRRQQGGTVCDP